MISLFRNIRLSLICLLLLKQRMYYTYNSSGLILDLIAKTYLHRGSLCIKMMVLLMLTILVPVAIY